MWTAAEIPGQESRNVIVTGANTGIGYETALALYAAGANVMLACRDQRKAEQALAKMQQSSGSGSGSGSLEIGVLDLADLSSVRLFAETYIQQHEQLDLLINNAGVGTPPAGKSRQGWEYTFGVNFLGPFALTGRLYPLLEATPGSRVVTVSSFAYARGVIDFDNLKSEKGYDAVREYSQNKLADLMFSIELDRRVRAQGHQVVSIAAQPGANSTEITRHSTEEQVAAMKDRFGGFMDPWQGALPSLYAAVSSEATAGNLYEPHENGFKGYPVKGEIQEVALDETVAKKLWTMAEEATGVVYPA
ncbi:oxidoreductase [Streptomyces sp. NPDC090119]|uniref:oxidoreductase n=1 Tax=Streptomyces sp. NPDC090119 TaxID=3365951 RepID=UPI0038068946